MIVKVLAAIFFRAVQYDGDESSGTLCGCKAFSRDYSLQEHGAEKNRHHQKRGAIGGSSLSDR